MSYEPGMVRFNNECIKVDEFGKCDCPDYEFHSKRLVGKVYLPHSCDEWIIGGRPEVEALIADLQAVHDRLSQ